MARRPSVTNANCQLDWSSTTVTIRSITATCTMRTNAKLISIRTDSTSAVARDISSAVRDVSKNEKLCRWNRSYIVLRRSYATSWETAWLK